MYCLYRPAIFNDKCRQNAHPDELPKLLPLSALSIELLDNDDNEFVRFLDPTTILSTPITLLAVKSIGDCLNNAFGGRRGSICACFGQSRPGRGTLFGSNFNGLGGGLRGIL